MSLFSAASIDIRSERGFLPKLAKKKWAVAASLILIIIGLYFLIRVPSLTYLQKEARSESLDQLETTWVPINGRSQSSVTLTLSVDRNQTYGSIIDVAFQPSGFGSGNASFYMIVPFPLASNVNCNYPSSGWNLTYPIPTFNGVGQRLGSLISLNYTKNNTTFEHCYRADFRTILQTDLTGTTSIRIPVIHNGWYSEPGMSRDSTVSNITLDVNLVLPLESSNWSFFPEPRNIVVGRGGTQFQASWQNVTHGPTSSIIASYTSTYDYSYYQSSLFIAAITLGAGMSLLLDKIFEATVTQSNPTHSNRVSKRGRVARFRDWSQKLPRSVVFWIGAIVGGIGGVVLTIFALSALLFQVLQAVTTAVLALATVVLAFSTLQLYRTTRQMAETEIKRDRRTNLEKRIDLADRLVHTHVKNIIDPLKAGGPPVDSELMIVMWIRELRQLISYSEGQTDNEIFQLLPFLDLLIMRLDKADAGDKAIENEADEKAVRGWIESMQKVLRVLVARWRSQVPYLYD
jgi:hypothetical protein